MLLMKRKHQDAPQPENKQPVKTDISLAPPIRQTASIFKQSVTVVRSRDSKVRTDLNHGNQEKPKQLFWEKRLQGLWASDKNEKAIENFKLPRKIKAVGLELSEETLLRSITTALHLNGHPVTGQNRPKSLLEKSPGVYINPSQPLVLGLHVTEDDIQEQEQKVEEARQKLKEALNEYAK